MTGYSLDPDAITQYLTESEESAILRTAILLGRLWKSRIQDMWLRGSYNSLGIPSDDYSALQRIRNKLTSNQFRQLRCVRDDSKVPYAYSMTLVFHDLSTKRINRVCSSENAARRLGGMMRSVRDVTDLEPYTLEQYRRAFGYRRIGH
jgi:hypothetical protein